MDGTYPQLSTPVRAHGGTPLQLLPPLTFTTRCCGCSPRVFPPTHQFLSASSSLSWMDGEREGGAETEHAQCVQLRNKRAVMVSWSQQEVFHYTVSEDWRDIFKEFR